MSEVKKYSQQLQAIVDTILQVARPERIILFGSRAQVRAQAESDYDFLVVVRGIRNEREVSRRIYRALLDNKVGVAVDVVVVNAGTLEQHKDSPFYVYRQALREGRVFYEHGGV